MGQSICHFKQTLFRAYCDFDCLKQRGPQVLGTHPKGFFLKILIEIHSHSFLTLCISWQSVTNAVLEVTVAWVTPDLTATRVCKSFSFKSNFGDRCSCFFLSHQFSRQWQHFFEEESTTSLAQQKVEEAGRQKPYSFPPALLSHTEYLTIGSEYLLYFLRSSQFPLHFLLARELSARGFT